MNGLDLQIRLAENIKLYRKQKGYTQSVLAEKANVSDMTVKKVETCKQWPSEDKIVAMANALDIDVYKLFLPVPSSFEINDDVRASVQKAATDGYKQFMQGVADSLGE